MIQQHARKWCDLFCNILQLKSLIPPSLLLPCPRKPPRKLGAFSFEAREAQTTENPMYIVTFISGLPLATTKNLGPVFPCFLKACLNDHWST